MSDPVADAQADDDGAAAHEAARPPEVLKAPEPARAEVVRQRIESETHGFSFYAIMRMLEAVHPESPRFGRSVRPKQDTLRLAQEPSVAHAPAALSSFEPGDGTRPDRLLVHFFGLFGPDGPLPLHLTEYARDRRRNYNDSTFQRFADIFHHRAISLFYRAWADVRPTVSFDRPEHDRFGDYVGALIGLSTPGLRNRDAMPDLTKLHFAGLLASQTRNAEGLGQILSEFFTMPVRVESFVGGWLVLPNQDLTRLADGEETASLGRSTVLGGKVWSRQHRFRLVFGPLDLADYERLLPDGMSFHRLVPIVRNYAGDQLVWDISLILRTDAVPDLRLGRQGRLGWTTWLKPRRATTPAADLFLDASADSHASQVHSATHL
jgi:type VI secretion system protein ImpH